MTRDDRYLVPILSNFQLSTLSSLPRIVRILGNPESFDSEALALSNRYDPKGERKKRRVPAYKAKPERLLIMHMVHYLFIAKSLGFDKYKYFADLIAKMSDFLSKKDLEGIFLEKELVRLDPSAVANTIYYFQFLGIVDLEDKLLDFYKENWLNYEPKDDIEWNDKVYALTHVIIAGTYFYQRILDKEKFSWILSFFESNIDLIKERTNSDIVAEVGLCFKLCGDKENDTIKVASDFVVSRFDHDNDIVPRESGEFSLEKAEHRNILSVLLLSSWDELSGGPDLYSNLKERGRSFYVPEKGIFLGFEETEV